jgi:nucleotide-binding universal stress UspA family protein
MGRIRRILHPTDFSRASTAAFKRALEMAKANRAELLLVNVFTPSIPPLGEAYVSPKTYAEMEASARAYGTKQLEKLVVKARRAGARVRGLLLEGLPHECIANNRPAQAGRSRRDGHCTAHRLRRGLPWAASRAGSRDPSRAVE